jgi:hypothetical protein
MVAHFVHIEDDRITFGYLDGLLKECQDCFDWDVEWGSSIGTPRQELIRVHLRSMYYNVFRWIDF